MHRAKAFLVSVVTILGGLSLLVSATGWLYLAGPHVARWPGPKVADALPLDELPGKDPVPLLFFVIVWVIAAGLLGALARRAGLERVTAALMLALAVGLWLYLLDGFSIYLVRGLARREILLAGSRLQAVYLPASLAGLAGAASGRPAHARTWAPAVVGLVVAASGLLGMISAVTPEAKARLAQIQGVLPTDVPRLASAAVAALGVVLLMEARGLLRRKRRAWLLAVVILTGSALLHLLKGLDYDEAIVTGLSALLLIARRQDFDLPGDPESRPRAGALSLLFLLVIYAYGFLAILMRFHARPPFSPRLAATETTRALLGLRIGGSALLGSGFGDWFPLSVLLLGISGAGAVLLAWLAPWRYRLRPESRHRAAALRLVREWGADTLAPFTLRADKSYFFDPDDRAFLAYRVVAGVALVSGDPVGQGDRIATLAEGFLRYAHERDWRVAVLGASEDRLALWRAHGLRALNWGDEALLDVQGFSLEGKPIRKVRQAVHRLRRYGFTSEILHPGAIGGELRQELQAIYRAWEGGERRKGFVMSLGRLFDLDGDDALFAIGLNLHDEPAGFLHFAVCPPSGMLSLSSMPRLRDTPNGFNEWLICETIGWARRHGVAALSLNFSPFASVLVAPPPLPLGERLERSALHLLKARMGFQLDNLQLFTGQFHPSWIKRYVLYERWSDLPRVGIAALSAEGYLPFGETSNEAGDLVLTAGS